MVAETKPVEQDEEDFVVQMSYTIFARHVTWIRREGKRQKKSASAVLRDALDKVMAEEDTAA